MPRRRPADGTCTSSTRSTHWTTARPSRSPLCDWRSSSARPDSKPSCDCKDTASSRSVGCRRPAPTPPRAAVADPRAPRSLGHARAPARGPVEHRFTATGSSSTPVASSSTQPKKEWCQATSSVLTTAQAGTDAHERWARVDFPLAPRHRPPPRGDVPPRHQPLRRPPRAVPPVRPPTMDGQRVIRRQRQVHGARGAAPCA